MDVRIVTFPATRVACLTHVGSPQTEHDTARKLVAWKLEQGLRDPVRYRSYGLHHCQFPGRPAGHRVDFCLSIDGPVAPNAFGIQERQLPAQRCALARDIGSRLRNPVPAWLFQHWLPASGEQHSGAPLIFHYVNVGPAVKDEEAITDVYLPLA